MLHLKSSSEAETVFYEAFRYGDTEVMGAVWARENAICVHPGSGIISGHEAILRSWRHVIGNGGYADLDYHLSRQTIIGNLAVHVVVEEMMDNGAITAIVIATNVYQRFEQGWLITEHHASLMQNRNRGQTLQ